jgi:hypothetical protein
MGVDELADVVRGRDGIPHRLEHLRGERQVEQRVDKQGLVAVRDQPRVAPAPSRSAANRRNNRARDRAAPSCIATGSLNFVRHDTTCRRFDRLGSGGLFTALC